MARRTIRRFKDNKRFCDVIVEDNNEPYLETKSHDKKGRPLTLRIPWNDVVCQVESARQAANQ
jgi:hypothetical protein